MISKTNIVVLFLFLGLISIAVINYPINPIAIDYGVISIRWYGLLFLSTMIIAKIKMDKEIKKINQNFSGKEVNDLLMFIIIGMIVGARLLYVLVYTPNKSVYLTNPIEIIAVWHGGLSFHGGLIGIISAVYLYCYKYKVSFLKIMDIIALITPVGLAEGRLGNFINGELWGKTTNLPIGIVFPSGGPLARHPTQLYECFLEGVILFFILKVYATKTRPKGSVCGLFLIMYALFRCSIELIREPDLDIGYLAWNWLTTGQLLCVPMLIVGLVLIYSSKKYNIS